MKNFKNYILLVFCIGLGYNAYSQEGTSKSERERVEKSTSPFSTNYFAAANNSYYVITLAFEKGRVLVDEKSRIVEVPGKFPYPSGNLNVKVLDRQGEKITDYFMQDPMIVRSCEEKGSSLMVLEKGTMQLLLPKSDKIAMIELIRNGKSIAKVNVSPVLARFLREREN